jgi:hypothetical protein
MTYRRIVTAAACAAAMCAALAGPVAGASASKHSIKLALKSYSGKILTSEGHVVSALGEYKTTKNPAPAEAALGEAVTVLKGLRAKVAAQGAATPRVKEAKVKIEEGLHAVVVAYTSLSTALADKASDPSAATAEIEKFAAVAKKGSKELHQGALLLGA